MEPSALDSQCRGRGGRRLLFVAVGVGSAPAWLCNSIPAPPSIVRPSGARQLTCVMQTHFSFSLVTLQLHVAQHLVCAQAPVQIPPLGTLVPHVLVHLVPPQTHPANASPAPIVRRPIPVAAVRNASPTVAVQFAINVRITNSSPKDLGQKLTLTTRNEHRLSYSNRCADSARDGAHFDLERLQAPVVGVKLHRFLDFS